MSDELEKKLAEFRAKRFNPKSETNSNNSLNISNIFGSIRQRFAKSEESKETMNDNVSQTIELLSNPSNSDSEEPEETEFPVDDFDEDKSLFDCDKRQALTIAIKVLIYILCQTIAFLLEFGAVFFAIAVLFFICTNLRNRSKRKGELSAYSVFNPNCKPIHGTVSAKDLENQLTFGALHHI